MDTETIEGHKNTATTDTLKMEYSEICTSYHNVRDRELKLLTLVPIASTIAASIFIKTTDRNHGVSVALLSFLLTLGLFLYSLRGTQHAATLIEQGCSLEKGLGLTTDNGQFSGRPAPWFGGYTLAVALIYVPVLLAWAYAAYLAL